MYEKFNSENGAKKDQRLNLRKYSEVQSLRQY